MKDRLFWPAGKFHHPIPGQALLSTSSWSCPQGKFFHLVGLYFNFLDRLPPGLLRTSHKKILISQLILGSKCMWVKVGMGTCVWCEWVRVSRCACVHALFDGGSVCGGVWVCAKRLKCLALGETEFIFISDNFWLSSICNFLSEKSFLGTSHPSSPQAAWRSCQLRRLMKKLLTSNCWFIKKENK